MIAFLLAAAIAGASTFLVAKRFTGPAKAPGTVPIVAAAKDLTPGMALTKEDLTTIQWPENVPLPGSVKKLEEALGRPVLASVKSQQPILDRDLAAPGSGFGLSGKIPSGMRATAVRSNDVVGVAGFLFPGSHVDVVVTYASPAGGTTTQTVLQNVEVLSTGSSIEPDPQGKPQTVNVVTLLLTPEDSQKMLLAQAQGSIQFVLRSGVDREIANVSPTRMDQLVANAAAPAPPPAVAATPTPRAVRPKIETPPPAPPAPVVEVPKPPEPHIIEVIQGTQRTTQKF